MNSINLIFIIHGFSILLILFFSRKSLNINKFLKHIPFLVLKIETQLIVSNLINYIEVLLELDISIF